MRSFVSWGMPVNSIPFPTPGSDVRTTAVMVICSASSQISTRKTVPSGKGIMLST